MTSERCLGSGRTTQIFTYGTLHAHLGAPGHTFRYIDRERPVIADHVWSCGCGAREVSATCDLVPCARHAYLDPVAHALAGDVRATAKMPPRE